MKKQEENLIPSCLAFFYLCTFWGAVHGVNLLFIAAGMGGGTGTGAAPVIAKIAREKGCITVAVVTKPFEFEGRKRQQNALKGIANLRKHVDTLVVIPNDKLLSALPQDVSMIGALKFADETLRQGICGIADLIATPALINLDFADVRTIIKDQGLAHMGVGRAKGDNRVLEAAKKAISSPLLETTIEGAKGVILNITGGEDMTLMQVTEIAKIIRETVDDVSANIIFGANVREDFEEEIEITVIATGFENRERMPRVEQRFEQPVYERPTYERQVEKDESRPFSPTSQPKVENDEFSQPKVENGYGAKTEESPVKHVIPTVNPEHNYGGEREYLPIDDEKVDEKPEKKMPAFMQRLFNKK
ncbi:MAG: cell division protein FtsZ [Clostridia bacterium]|nr:cell division protein FtsZ [Clostridia bacterium]